MADSSIIQMAPTIHHQVRAVFSILERYKWSQFSVVAAETMGHNAFITAIRQERSKDKSKTKILQIIEIKNSGDPDDVRLRMKPLEASETRVIVLFAHENAAMVIFQIAAELGLTGADHMWICTQKVVGDLAAKISPPSTSYPIGMLGIDVNMTDANMVKIVENGIKIWGHALDALIRKNNLSSDNYSPNVTCDSNDETWPMGRNFYKAMREVKVPLGGANSPAIEFTADGSIRYAEFDIVNLVLDAKRGTRSWMTIGSWNTVNGLQLTDIVWPGNSPVPPRGKPEKFHLNIVTLEEEPFVIMKPPGPKGKCEARAGRCRVRATNATSTPSANSTDEWEEKCCTGLSIDLLMKLSTDIGFVYDIYQVEDRKFGAQTGNGTWNGVVGDLMDKDKKNKAHLAMTSLSVTEKRQAVIDFSTVYLETGIAIVVAKREGSISPTAFLQPFNYVTWIVLVVACIQVVSIFIFAFEWLSPSGFNMQRSPDEDNRFSFFRVYWLVFTIFFGATCSVQVPRSFTAKFLTLIWVCCAFIFIAVYTANLATFMITREEFIPLVGITDKRFHFPYEQDPQFKFGTIGSGSTAATVRHAYKKIYDYMQQFNMDTVTQGIEAIKNGRLDAFLYDATVLEYRVGSDHDCKILTVGSWFATTGYAIAFPKGSPFIGVFNEYLLKYQQEGDLEQLRRFWLTGACKSKNLRNDKSSHALGIKNFTSAFIFLGAGIVTGVLCLITEWLYYQCIRFGVCRTVFDSNICRFLSVNVSRAVMAIQAQQAAATKTTTVIDDATVLEEDIARIWKQLVVAKMQVNKLENIHRRLRKSPSRRQNSIAYKFQGIAAEVSANQVHHRRTYSGHESNDVGSKSKLQVVEMETVL